MNRMSCFRRALLGAALLTLAMPAAAQDDPPDDIPDDPNSLTIGIGGAWRPTYDGSDDYEFGPIGLAFGKLAGFGFSTRGSALAIDLIREPADAPLAFELGPVVNLRFDRTGGIKDPQVRALGKIDTAIEVGVSAGVKKNGVLHKYDSLGFRLQYQKDVSNTHDSSILSPSIDYMTPLSTRNFVQLSLAMERVGNGYARTYYSVTPAGSLASGLPAFNADGGWKSKRASVLFGQSITGDLRHPKLSLFALGSYGRLQGDFARSPVVSVAGDRDQYMAVAGLAYTF